MTGTPSELIDSIKVLFPPGPRCSLLCEAVEYLLRVVRGSGMGHLHSGCIADCSFFALGEREFAARSQVLQSFGVKRYYRYRDDVLMICSMETRDARVFSKCCEERSSRSSSKLKR